MKTLRLFFLSLMTIITCNLFAVSIWSGSSDIFTSGAGTAASPYLIQSADQLAFIAEMVNGGVTHYENEYFKLTTDVDLNNIVWTPIGDTESNYFAGNFDGDNHKIYNVNVNCSGFAGFFGCVKSNSIKSFTIANGAITSTNGPAAGIIAQTASNCIVYNCINYANINSTNFPTGGVVGQADSIILSKTANYGQISGGPWVGGIIGKCNQCQIINATNFGNVSGNNDSFIETNVSRRLTDHRSGINSYNGNPYNDYDSLTTYSIKKLCRVGGIVGYSQGTQSSVLGCSNYGDISGNITALSYRIPKYNNSYNTGQYGSSSFRTYRLYYAYIISVYLCSGGIAGQLSGTLQNCSNKGDLLETSTGGVTITNGYNISSGQGRYDVKSLQRDQSRRTGGLVGDADCFIYSSYNLGRTPFAYSLTGTRSSISYCYNKGTGQGLSNKKSTIKCSYNAGVSTQCGIADSSTITNCYYTSGTGGGTLKTEAQMKSAAMPILLNTDSTVFIRDITPDVNDGYPIFKDGHIYVKTHAPTSLSYTSTTLNANYYGCIPDSMGFEVQDISDNSIIRYTANNAQPCSMQLGNLDQGTTYSAKYWLAYDGFTYYGDTVMFTTLACPTHPVQSDTVSICEGETYEFAGRTLSASGVYRDSLVAITGCDSVVELVLRIYDTYKYVRFDTIMQGESYDFYGTQLTETGVYNEYIRTTNRCNWVQLNLFVKEPPKTLTVSCNDSTMGSVSGSGVYEVGSDVTITAASNEHYHFVRWSDEITENPRIVIVTSDTLFEAIFAINKYVIAFKNEDSTLLQLDTLGYGAMPVYRGEDPVKPNEDESFFVFVGWNPEIVAVIGDATYYATYESHGTGFDNVTEKQKPIKVMEDGHLYILLPDGTCFDATGKKVE